MHRLLYVKASSPVRRTKNKASTIAFVGRVYGTQGYGVQY